MKQLFLLFLLFFTTDSFATGFGNVSSAPCDNDTLNKYTGTANVEINWEPNTINLNWYNGDEKLTVANNSQSCVYDGTLTVPTQPTKPGYTFNGWKVIRVPGGFTELEYIESTGTQYIDTGVRLTSDNVTYEWEAKDSSDLKSSLFGSEYGQFINGADDRTFSGILYSSKHNRYAYLGSTGIAAGVVYNSDDGAFHTWVWAIKADHTSYWIKDGIEEVNFSWSGTLSKTNSIAVFCNHTTSSFSQYASAAFKYFRIIDNGNTVFNGIPARRNSDGVLGMYDTISNTFKTNLGSGTFVAGPAVQ